MAYDVVLHDVVLRVWLPPAAVMHSLYSCAVASFMATFRLIHCSSKQPDKKNGECNIREKFTSFMRVDFSVLSAMNIC